MPQGPSDNARPEPPLQGHPGNAPSPPGPAPPEGPAGPATPHQSPQRAAADGRRAVGRGHLIAARPPSPAASLSAGAGPAQRG